MPYVDTCTLGRTGVLRDLPSCLLLRQSLSAHITPVTLVPLLDQRPRPLFLLSSHSIQGPSPFPKVLPTLGPVLDTLGDLTGLFSHPS